MKLLSSVLALSALLLLGFNSPVRAEISDDQFAKAIEKYLGTDKGQEQVGSATRKYFEKLQMEQVKARQAKADSEIEEQFKNPVKIDIGSSPSKGPADAKVTVVEFSDFQCPYCTRGAKTIEQIVAAYPKDVKVVFKNMPLDFHDQAKPAAKAALAAHKQGKFWEYHDILFANQQGLNEAFYVEQAQKLGLNVDKFKADMASPEVEKQLESDIAIAKQNGIEGTPGFFVNGVAVRGAYPFEHFKKIIDRWLSGNPTAAPKA